MLIMKQQSFRNTNSFLLGNGYCSCDAHTCNCEAPVRCVQKICPLCSFVALFCCVRLYPCSEMKIHDACMLTTLQSLPSFLTWIRIGLILMPNYFWTWQPCCGRRVVGHNSFIGFLKRCRAVSKPIIATHNEDIPGTWSPIEPLVYSCLYVFLNSKHIYVALRHEAPTVGWTYQRYPRPIHRGNITQVWVARPFL